MATILIVDDDLDTRNLLNDTLTPEGYTIHMAANGLEALDAVQGQVFDLALVDVVLPGLSGVELVYRLKEQTPHTAVIIITSYPSLQTAVQALRNQVFDYLEKPFDLHYLRATVRKALTGRHPPSLQASHRPGQGNAAWESLTEREREVLTHLAAGQCNKHIADTLNISEKTVETHVGNLLNKLGVASRTEAAVWVWRQGLAAEMGLSG